MIDCLVAQILEFYPEIKLKSKRADHVKHVILSHYSQDFQDLDSLAREIRE